MTTKVILYFPSDATDKAVTYDLVKRYDLRINILRAEIEAGRSGSLLVELAGDEPMVREGVAYLERNGVTVSPWRARSPSTATAASTAATARWPASRRRSPSVPPTGGCTSIPNAASPANSVSKAAPWAFSISNSPRPEPWSTSNAATGAAWGVTP